MELTSEEREMLRRIVDNRYAAGGYKRATWISTVCRTGADKAVLAALCAVLVAALVVRTPLKVDVVRDRRAVEHDAEAAARQPVADLGVLPVHEGDGGAGVARAPRAAGLEP